MLTAPVNVPIEFALRIGDGPSASSREVEVLFAGEENEYLVPAFWSGENLFRVRFAPPAPGRYRWELQNGGEVLAGPREGELEAVPYEGANPLYRHGRLRLADDGRSLAHADGTRFFWLGDTWWAGLSPRLPWPDAFRELTADRVEKGYNVIQIVVGPQPMFAGPDAAWHPQQRNEGGWPWEPGWAELNPAFYDAADLRIAHLVEQGLVPCIFAMWGEFLPQMGVDRAKRHWRNLVARYAAYPVVLCLSGEGDLRGGLSTVSEQRAAWTEIGRYVREIDPFGNLVTIHPAHPESRVLVDDDSVIDFSMLQTSHFGYHEPPPSWAEAAQSSLELTEPPRWGLAGSVEVVANAVGRKPSMPVINAEPAYEGHWGANWQDVQRFLFWTHTLSGTVGHTYGAQGIWNMNSASDPWDPTPRYPGTGVWQAQGEGSWQEAMHYPGSRQVALGRRFFERFRWWEFEPLLQEEAAALGRRWSFAAGIPGEVVVLYLASTVVDHDLQGIASFDPYLGTSVGTIPVDGSTHATFFDPRTGADVKVGPPTPDDSGRWPLPMKPTDEDWVLVLETVQT